MSTNGSLLAGDLPNRGPAVLAVTTATLVFASLFFFARIICRIFIVRKVGWDDWFMILAWLLAFGLSFSVDYGTTKGLGRTDAGIKDEWKPALRKSEYAFTVLYNPALIAVKTSILIFYLRLSRNTISLLRLASLITLGIVIISGGVLTFLNIFQCKPVTAAYHVSSEGAQCIGILTLYLASAPVTIITDIAILLLPIPVLTAMNLPSKQKTVLVFNFSLGIFVIAVDVVRIYYLQKASLNQVTGVIDNSGNVSLRVDYTYNSSLSFMWSCIEVNTCIICACIPTLKPLIAYLIPSLVGSLPRSSGNAPYTFSNGNTMKQTKTGRSNSVPMQPTLSRQQAPLPHSKEKGDPDIEMVALDFLTTPDVRLGAVTEIKADYGADLQKIPSAKTGSRLTKIPTGTAKSKYFGSLSMRPSKNLMNTKDSESFKYCVLVVILFFLWGFSYGLLNTLNNEIGRLYHNTDKETLGLQAAYFGAYAIGPLTIGQWVLRHGGFKATFISGLCIYGIGTLSFWPSAVLTSFPGFVVSNFITGLGLSILETAANPFIALCGPMKHSEYRLLLAQGVQAVGSIFSPLIAQKALFRSVQTNSNLIDVQWTYLGISFFSVALALLFYYISLPEALDEELQEQADMQMLRSFPENLVKPKIGALPIVWTTLAIGVLAQWFYVAAQESVSVWFSALLAYFTSSSMADAPAFSSDNYLLIGHSMFAAGRFVFAFLSLYVTPRILLLVSFICSLLFTTLTFAISKNNSNAIASSILCLFFFEGPIWPTIYAIALRNLGKNTRLGAAFLTFGASGGSAFPFVMYSVQGGHEQRIQYSFCVVVALFCAALVYPIYLNIFSSVRRLYDPDKKSQIGNSESGASINVTTRPPRNDRGSPSSSPIRKLSDGFVVLFTKMKDSGGRRGSYDDSIAACVEHREQRVGSANTSIHNSESPSVNHSVNPSIYN